MIKLFKLYMCACETNDFAEVRDAIDEQTLNDYYLFLLHDASRCPLHALLYRL